MKAEDIIVDALIAASRTLGEETEKLLREKGREEEGNGKVFFRAG